VAICLFGFIIIQSTGVTGGIGWEKLKDQCSTENLQCRWAIRNLNSSTNFSQSQLNNHCLCSIVGMIFFPEPDFSSCSQVGGGLAGYFSREPLFRAASNASSFLNEFQLQEISVLEASQ
jgi:hypothetical protein